MPAGFQAFGSSSGFVGSAAAPQTIANLKLWLRSDKGITIGTGVSQWADQSATGDVHKNVAQATGSKQPTYVASDPAYGGCPTLGLAAASSQWLASGLWTSPIAQPWTVFTVGQDDGSGSVQIYTESGSDLLGSNRVLVYQNSGGYELNAGVSLAGVGKSAAPRVLGAVVNGASSKLYNSARTAALAGNAGTHGPLGAFFVGSVYAGAAFLNGKIAEVIVYAGALSDAQMAPLWSYFAARYGIAIGA